MHKARPPRTARNTMMDLLARRDHSEKELRKKLKEKEFSPEEIEKAIIFGKENRWIPDSEEEKLALSERFAASLGRRGKGALYIKNKLHEKGLPTVGYDSQEELEKALTLVKTKWKPEEGAPAPTREQKAKLGRFLISRGFAPDIVRKVIYEKL